MSKGVGYKIVSTVWIATKEEKSKKKIMRSIVSRCLQGKNGHRHRFFSFFFSHFCYQYVLWFTFSCINYFCKCAIYFCNLHFIIFLILKYSAFLFYLVSSLFLFLHFPLHILSFKLLSTPFLKFIYLLIFSDLYTQYRARTHNLDIKSPTFFQLSQPGIPLSTPLALFIFGPFLCSY